MSDKKVSIIVPIYNTGKYLRECLDSLLNQTLRDIEIICIDDGSTDDSGIICDEYKNKDERIKVIHQNNGGVVLARKVGLKVAQGKYIGFVDSDDYVEQDMYESLYLKIEDTMADFVNSSYICHEVEPRIVRCKEAIINIAEGERITVLKEMLLGQNSLSCNLWPKLFKSEVIKSAYFELKDNQCYGEDLLTIINCLFNCKKIYMYNKAFYHYRIIPGSMSHADWGSMCLKESKLYDACVEIMEKHNAFKECAEALLLRYERRLLSLIRNSCKYKNFIECYQFPDIQLLRDRSIIIYGAGNVGKSYYSQISKYQRCKIVAWVDKADIKETEFVTIQKPDIIKSLKYDMILLAVKKKELADEIKEELMKTGICNKETSFVWQQPESIVSYMT